MALWYLCALLFATFSGLYFAYDPARINATDNKEISIVGIFDICRDAGLAQARKNKSLGSFGVYTFDCTANNLSAYKASHINAPYLKISIVQASVLYPGALGRRLYVFLPHGFRANYVQPPIRFNDAIAQLMEAHGAEIQSGIVQIPNPPIYDINGKAINKLDNGAVPIILAPSIIYGGSFASTAVVD